ncbi:hypothetical protein TSUD_36060 [Trifolium subterraneum]|uniref:Uncharacterized protein n=1 Tax=Trifolium subterraneum TaxID=3900 RepID=A0A2Z6P986_TRISU|nr:hypothetical protein TSUD_36060 [Trifolium subterraneum]
MHWTDRDRQSVGPIVTCSLTSTRQEEGPFGKNRTAPLPHEKSDSYKSFNASRQHGATVQSQH